MSPATLPELYLNAFSSGDAERLLYRAAHRGWRGVTGAEIVRDAARLGAALAECGVGPGTRVALAAESVRFVPGVELAVFAAGGVVVHLYPAPAAELAARIADTGARVALVQGGERAAALAERGVPGLDHVLRLDGPGMPGAPSLVEALEGHADADVEALRERARERKPEDPAAVFFTAGTTGEPRQVVYTHGQLTEVVTLAGRAIPLRAGQTALSGLPPASPLGRVLDLLFFDRGLAVACPESPSAAAGDLVQARPHVVVGSFLLYKGLMNQIYDVMRRQRPLVQKLFRRSVALGRRGLGERLAGRRPQGPRHALAERYFFRPLRQLAGGRVEVALSTGMPLTQGWLSFLWAAGLPVCEAYGAAEAPLVALNVPGVVRLESAGQPLPDVDVDVTADGEVRVRGPVVGGETDGDGWWSSGDLGSLDDGYLSIAGRRGEGVELASGETLEPMLLDRLYGGSHFVAHAVVTARPGERPVLLLEPDFERLETVVRVHRIETRDRAELVRHPRIRKIFEAELGSFEELVPAAVRPRAWELCDQVWSVEGGELTAAGTVRRQPTIEKYAAVIERLQVSPSDEPGDESPGYI